MTTNGHVIVIGASTGGFEALQRIAADLPADFPAPILVVLHVAAHSPNAFDQVLGKAGPLPVRTARNGDEIKAGQVYVAPADQHLLIHPSGRLLTTRGPKENRFRPAIDPLFRSAAAAYGRNAIGVILTGYLDDGTAGLAAIRKCGGIAVVQNPEDAVAPAMPMNAIRQVEVNHIVRLEDMGTLLTKLASQPVNGTGGSGVDQKMELELRIAREERALDAGITGWGVPSHFACPECHGVLLSLKEEKSVRYRCHTGHAYSLETLLAEFGEKTHDALWTAVRCIDETTLMLEQRAAHLEGHGHQAEAVILRKKIAESSQRGQKVRAALMSPGRHTSPEQGPG